MGAYVRRGQLTLVAAPPGTGKSLFAQALAHRGDDNGTVPSTLYFSADSDAGTFAQRAAAIATGYQLSDIQRLIQDRDDAALEEAIAAQTGHMRMGFASNVSDQDMLDEIDAYAEVFGKYPDCIVMDNLSNLSVDGAENEFHGLQENCFFLHDIARETNSAVITLHHVSGEYEGGDKPIPLSGLRGKVSKTPEVIFTMYRSGEVMNVSVVKNRSGKAFADGSNAIKIPVDLSRMRLG
ncbi:MAG: AAA family ATPase [Brevibacterium sp.]